jgi:exodeoxyribonuclease-3
MRIIGWNLNHRIQPKGIPQEATEVIRRLAPDILVLTEYVDGDGRLDFKQALRGIGLTHIAVSENREGHNQVLVASRSSHGATGVPYPKESHGRTNFLTISFGDPEFTLIGIRAPAYKATSDVKSYWAGLMGILDGIATQRIVVVGDLNGDPDDSQSVGGKQLKLLRDKGWKVPVPTGEWSYMSSDGRSTSRIDHVLASPSIGGATASYLPVVNGTVAAGPKGSNPISDHAIICCEVDLG